MTRSKPRPRRLLGRTIFACWALAGIVLGGTVGACSIDNIEGPDVGCADLQCGRYNACLNGIIAQCLDGKTVRYFVCTDTGEDVCDASWQTPGAFRCEEFQTDCEGCRPDRSEGCSESN
jgi:hypothetical protein